MILRKKLMLLAFAGSLAACSAPIQNVDHATFATAAGKNLTTQQVRAAIIRAGAALGWEMKDDGPSALTGTLHLRKHTAVVEIPYSATDYSIKYLSSVNLNEKNGKIHKNYNGWVQNLSKGINIQLQLVNN